MKHLHRSRVVTALCLCMVLIVTSGATGGCGFFGEKAPQTASGKALAAEDIQKKMIVMGAAKVADLTVAKSPLITPAFSAQFGAAYDRWQQADTAALKVLAAWRAAGTADSVTSSDVMARLAVAVGAVLGEIGKVVPLGQLQTDAAKAVAAGK